MGRLTSPGTPRNCKKSSFRTWPKPSGALTKPGLPIPQCMSSVICLLVDKKEQYDLEVASVPTLPAASWCNSRKTQNGPCSASITCDVAFWSVNATSYNVGARLNLVFSLQRKSIKIFFGICVLRQILLCDCECAACIFCKPPVLKDRP